MASISDKADKAIRLGSFNYLTGLAEHSLYRNGEVLTYRDRDGNDAGWKGVELDKRKISVCDARLVEASARPTLFQNGFEVREQPLVKPDLDFFDNDQVVRNYYPHCTEIVREANGARIVAAFDHNIRSATGKKSKRRIEGGQQVQGPARMVHGDYTLTSAPQRLRDLALLPGANDTFRALIADGQSLLEKNEVDHALSAGRFAIINLWRNIALEPVETHPLALCDATSVRPEHLVVFEIHYHDRIGENYFAKHSESHQWYFYPELTRDEALLIKQWDSAGELARSGGANPDLTASDMPCTFSFHSAFEELITRPDAPDRWSIEVRCVALY